MCLRPIFLGTKKHANFFDQRGQRFSSSRDTPPLHLVFRSTSMFLTPDREGDTPRGLAESFVTHNLSTNVDVSRKVRTSAFVPDQVPSLHANTPGVSIRGVQRRKRAPFWGRFEGRFESRFGPQSFTVQNDASRFRGLFRHVQAAAAGNTDV